METVKNTALVTGANSGIGFAICAELAKRGYPLLMISNENEKLKEAASNLSAEYGIKAIPFCIDLAKIDSAQEILIYCQVNNITVEILVNNAGIFFFKDVCDTTLEKSRLMLNLHINTPFTLTQIFAKQMITEKRSGYILNMASISSRMMVPYIALYSSTKSFLRCFSRAMRNEVFDKGVSITTISPGAVATNLYNLPARYMKLGIFLGIIIKPARLASLAVKKMFKRKAEYIPGGFINNLFIFIVNILSEKSIRKIKRKIDSKIKS